MSIVRFGRTVGLTLVLVYAVAFGIASAQGRKQQTKSDAEIKQAIIAASIASYPGNCPCPYNRDRAGRSCGRRSAYSSPGGRAPLCYAEDVTQAMVHNDRKRSR